MKISLAWLKEKGACSEAVLEFKEKYGDQEIELQDLLDAMASANIYEWAQWLLNAAGKINTIREISGDLDIDGNLFIAGSLKITGHLKVKLNLLAGGGIEAGWGIKAGEGIEAGRGIKAGEEIEAGWGIRAGEDFGIYVGLSVKISLKNKYATVISKTKPENLLLGEWKNVEP